MGLDKESVFNRSNKEALKRVISTLLETQIALLDFSLLNIGKKKLESKVLGNEEEFNKLDEMQKKYKKGKKMCYKLQQKLGEITKIDVLQSIYVNLISGKEVIWAYAPALVHQGIYFCTKKGYKEFLKIQEEERQKALAKIEEEKRIKEAISQGKKVENIVADGKIKKVIVDDSNAN